MRPNLLRALRGLAIACLAALPLAADAGEPTGVIFFGDAGTGGPAQHEIGAAVAAYCGEHPCTMIALLGDNFYPDGIDPTLGVDDPQWEQKFETPYAEVTRPFLPALGNHDHRGDTQAQIDYSERSTRWQMPAAYYSRWVNHVELFVLDTEDWNCRQRRWLRRGLRRSEAYWQVVYGHHPVYSSGKHGDTRALVRRLQPLLARRADLYLAGHDHHLEVIAPEDGVIYAISGAAGAKLRPVRPGPDTLYAASVRGFGYMTLLRETGVLRMIDPEGEVLFEMALERRDLEDP